MHLDLKLLEENWLQSQTGVNIWGGGRGRWWSWSHDTATTLWFVTATPLASASEKDEDTHQTHHPIIMMVVNFLNLGYSSSSWNCLLRSLVQISQILTLKQKSWSLASPKTSQELILKDEPQIVWLSLHFAVCAHFYAKPDIWWIFAENYLQKVENWTLMQLWERGKLHKGENAKENSRP